MHPFLQRLMHNPTFRKKVGLLSGLIVLLMALVLVLTWGKDLDERHRPVEFAEAFDFSVGTFADYTAYSERRLRAAHAEAPAEVITNLAPFRMEPLPECPASATATYRNGIVLTHDLLDSPYVLRELGMYFQKRCFLVYGLLLPDHGTQPGDLLDVDWETWVAAERMAVQDLATQVDNVYLGGHGAGGTLAILEASGNAGVDGLVLLAPLLDNTLNSFGNMAGTALGWLVPGARWSQVVPVYTPYRFESIPYHLASETNALIEAMQIALPTRPFEVPVFMVASEDDEVVKPETILAWMGERIHPLSRTMFFSRQPQEPKPGISYFNSYAPELTLIGVSHPGLPVPLNDPEFGWNGRSMDCAHYFHSDQDAYGRCMAYQIG